MANRAARRTVRMVTAPRAILSGRIATNFGRGRRITRYNLPMQRHRFLLLFASIAGLVILGCYKHSGTSAASGELRPLTVDQVAERIGTGDGKTFIYDNNS